MSNLKIKSGFVKKPFMDNVVVVPTGEASQNFKGVVKLNQTASLVWDCVSKGMGLEEIVNTMTAKYDVSKEAAKKDAETIISQMKDAGFFTEDESDL